MWRMGPPTGQFKSDCLDKRRKQHNQKKIITLKYFSIFFIHFELTSESVERALVQKLLKHYGVID